MSPSLILIDLPTARPLRFESAQRGDLLVVYRVVTSVAEFLGEFDCQL